MEASHPLKALLQFQLATDASAVLHLPYILSSLTMECLLPSSHLPKWTTRINSLLHSKDPGARWAGLCIAHKTSALSKTTMIECAQSWLGVALPLLSKNEPPPTVKSAIRLLRALFSSGVGISEYQRQVVTPNIPKFTAAIIAIAEKNVDDELRIMILATLTHLLPLYPTLYRASHTALSTLSLRLLNGSAPNPTNNLLLQSASHLYAVLHLTGGKVGAANIWRKSLDETLSFGWSAFLALRTTFPSEAPNAPSSHGVDDALMAIPLHLDRLRCCTVVIGDLLSSTTYRPVQLPLGPLVKFTSALLSCTKDDRGKEHADPTIQAMEISVIPEFWRFGCDLASCLAKCAQCHLTPNLTRLISYLTYHLEQKPTASQRLFLLTTIQTLLKNCHLFDSPLIPTRLAKAVLPSLSAVLATPADIQTSEDTATYQKNKKGKKRARGYEGDEVFKLSREVVCPGVNDGKVLLAALEVMRLVLRNPNLSPAMQSISVRLLLSILLALPQISPASLSSNLLLHGDLLHVVQSINTELSSGASTVMSKSLGMVVRAAISENNDDTLRGLEILLHPRVPPLVRSLPHVESLSLFRAEEPQEEADVREELGLQGAFRDQSKGNAEEDFIMKDSATLQNGQVMNIQPIMTDAPSLSSKPVPVFLTTSKIQQPSPAPPAATTTQQPLAPPPLLTSLTAEPLYSEPVKTSVAQPTLTPTIVTPMQEEDEDEEMPAINIDSDSDSD